MVFGSGVVGSEEKKGGGRVHCAWVVVMVVVIRSCECMGVVVVVVVEVLQGERLYR